LGWGQAGGRPMCFPWSLARFLPSAVRVRIRSRSTSARPPSTASIKRPVLVQVSAHGSASDPNSALLRASSSVIPLAPNGRGPPHRQMVSDHSKPLEREKAWRATRVRHLLFERSTRGATLSLGVSEGPLTTHCCRSSSGVRRSRPIGAVVDPDLTGALARARRGFRPPYDNSYRGVKLTRISAALGRYCLRRGVDLPQVA